MNQRIIIAVFLFLVSSTTSIDAQQADSLVHAAWAAWNKNDQHSVERLFREALAAQPANPRAHIGLSYLFMLQQDHEGSWEEFHRALETLEDPTPYLFAEWISEKLRSSSRHINSSIVPLFTKMAGDSQMAGTLQGPACDRLGEYYEARNDLRTSREYFGRQNTIDDWTLIGAFENISASGYDRIFPPETTYNAGATYEGKNGSPVSWFRAEGIRPDRWVDFTHFFSESDAVFYGNTFVFAPSRQRVQIRVGTSGSLKAFVNDEAVLEVADENNNDMDTYVAETDLQKGWNRLLIKCGYSEISACNFKVRVTDLAGKPVQGMKVSTDPQEYRRRPGAAARPVDNFAESFFRRKITNHPDHIENYLLLADTYLRNDKAVEAELVLEEALRIAPGCGVIHFLLLEAYGRGEKNDEMASTRETLTKLDPDIPSLVQYRVNVALENEQFDEAERLLAHLEKLRPHSSEVMESRIDFFAKKNQSENLIRAIDEAVETYPAEWRFSYLKALLAVRASHKPKEAFEIIERFLKREYTLTALEFLSRISLEASDIPVWESAMDRLLELRPDGPGYWYHKASVYQNLKRYDEAETAIARALRVCPGNSRYWQTRGDLLRTSGTRESAANAYTQALRFDPANFDARTALRDLQGKGYVFSRFDSVDVHALIREAPPAGNYPDDDALVILDDKRRVVYEGGASEYNREYIVRVHNRRGIDQVKEQTIDLNPYTERLTIEKAVTMKRDGTEIKADVDRSQVVFKSLEDGDVAYMKYRIRNLYSGGLARYFWDSYYLNLFYPVQLARYSLLTPAGLQYQHRTQQMPDSPTVRETPDGTLRVWSTLREPAIKSEPEMPTLDRVGKMVFVSSVPSWEDISRWYEDLTRTKIRSTYEITRQVREIVPDSLHLTDLQKVDRIYNFISDRIRYSNVRFRQSKLIPQKARDVLATRMGDCKDMATLFIAMLAELKIPAHFVLLNTRDDAPSSALLPSIPFNHAIVAVDLPGSPLSCDLTAPDYPLGTLPDADIEAYGLDIRPGVDALRLFTPKDFPPRTFRRTTSITVRDDMSVLIGSTDRREGNASATYRNRYRNKSRRDQEDEVKKVLESMYPGVKLVSFELAGIDSNISRSSLTYVAEVPQFLSGSKPFLVMKSPWTRPWQQWSGLGREQRTYPLEFITGLESTEEEVSIQLPKGYKPAEEILPVRHSCSFGDYSTDFHLERGTLKGRRRMVFNISSVSPEDYPAFKSFYNTVVTEDNKPLLLKKK